MKKLLFVVFLMVSLTAFSQSVSVGLGHWWQGAGNIAYGTATRELNLQISATYPVWKDFSFYAGVTKDSVLLQEWLVEHNFIQEIKNANELYAYDIGALYHLTEMGKASISIGAGISTYNYSGEVDNGFYVLVLNDFSISKNLFIRLKWQYRSHTSLEPLEQSTIESGLLVGYKF